MQEVLKGRTFRCAAINPSLATSARWPSGRRAVLLWVSSKTQSRRDGLGPFAVRRKGEVPRRLKSDETHASNGTAEAVPLQNLAIIHIIEAQKVTPTSRIVVGWSRSGFIT